MGAVAVIGEPGLVSGYALAGAVVMTAADDEAVRHAWAALDHDTKLVILTPAAARALTEQQLSGMPITVVMPV